MANKIIHDLTAASGAAATDEFEIQVAGETVTKRVTLTQLTQVEATARAAQDDVIEAGAGLATDGTFTAMTESWYLRASDFTAGFTDRGGAEATVTANLYNAIRMLDAKLYSSVAQLSSVVKTITVNCSAPDILACNAVPKILIPFSTDFVHEIISIMGVRLGDDYSATAYEAGTDGFSVRYTGGNEMFTFTNAFVEAAADMAERGVASADTTLKISAGIELYCATAPTGGTGVYQFNITYRTHVAVL